MVDAEQSGPLQNAVMQFIPLQNGLSMFVPI